MTLKSDALLTTQSDEIANEVAPNANSAARVGQMLKDLVDSKSSKVPDFEFEGTVEDATPVTSLGGDSMTLTLTEDCVHQSLGRQPSLRKPVLRRVQLRDGQPGWRRDAAGLRRADHYILASFSSR
jgi:hypothetical protein